MSLAISFSDVVCSYLEEYCIGESWEGEPCKLHLQVGTSSTWSGAYEVLLACFAREGDISLDDAPQLAVAKHTDELRKERTY